VKVHLVKVHLVKVHASWKDASCGSTAMLLLEKRRQAQLLLSKKGTRAISCVAKAI